MIFMIELRNRSLESSWFRSSNHVNPVKALFSNPIER